MKIEFLYCENCPSHEKGLARLNKVVNEVCPAESVEVIEVVSQEHAEEENFIGSPTIRINGRDIDPAGLEGERSSLSCRVYHLPDGRYSPLPSEDMIGSALEKLLIEDEA